MKTMYCGLDTKGQYGARVLGLIHMDPLIIHNKDLNGFSKKKNCLTMYAYLVETSIVIHQNLNLNRNRKY